MSKSNENHCLRTHPTVHVYVQIPVHPAFLFEGEVRQEADYINVALDTSGESYLKTMDNVHVDTRITLIDPDGKVKYDSKDMM